MKVARALIAVCCLAAGCATHRPTATSRPADAGPTDPAAMAPEPVAAEPSAVATTLPAPATPAAAPTSPHHVVRRDAFEIAPVSVLTVKREGALFAASSKAAIPAQRPRATCRVLRTHFEPRSENHGSAWDDYSIEILASGMPSLELEEQAVRSLFAPRNLITGPTTQPAIVATEIVIGSVRITTGSDEPDVTVLRAEPGTVRFERPSLEAALRAALTMIAEMRRASKAAP